MEGSRGASAVAGDLPGLSGRVLQAMARRIRHGTLTIQINDHHSMIRGEAAGPEAHLRLHRPWAFLTRLWGHGALGLGESYLAGHWETDDLTALLELLAVNEPYLGRSTRPNALARSRLLLEHRGNRNNHRGSRRNIAAHYDLGNAFYREWLDDTMTYSSALFEVPDVALEAAQNRKYQRILDRLDLSPGDHILEIGCGWGGLAIAAARRGARVTGLTLSQEQLAYARERVTELRLDEAIDLRLQDYRDVTGHFDHVVSIEMFEAVGEEYWPTYFESVARSLRPGGRAALQVITIDEDWYQQYRSTPDFIQRYVFPGGMLPTVEQFTRIAGATGLKVADMGFFGEHYARTLRRWHQQFLDALHRVEELGYDQHFQRIWRYYLSYCEAGFRIGRINLMQTTLQKPHEAACSR
ncbi:cyclopropane-fatty-acyl-phospholipid synthase [Natronocella acetinitrilica]|uniref:Cyclopropane-fatty-acyl-phospholipid synthase n=1 Tax=Natronocella acetinitrilica TaxID=414046 RepID=A0AAE3KA64_9GAMM|nr:cyclopropane-fatty-acyl-phospholipid synthase family protein [Natronocella acetinitrilica]MCP1673026.1 cyclopropane-fatty-acyl-phospholipid synthase [Natronocella acetinitrilica]